MLDSKLENRTFLILLAVVSIAFAWLLLPFYGAVFWGTILAIIFTPVHRRLQARLGGRRNLAALITLSACILIVILPVIFIAGSLVQEGANLYQSLKSGQLNPAGLVQQAFAALPPWRMDSEPASSADSIAAYSSEVFGCTGSCLRACFSLSASAKASSLRTPCGCRRSATSRWACRASDTLSPSSCKAG